MSKKLLENFQTAPDMGALKRNTAEYQSLQNIRGWGGLGSKRRAVSFSVSESGGIMGIFDLKTDGDPNSLDKILVINGNGDFTFYDFSELVSVFDYLFASGIGFTLQASNGTWWTVIPQDDGSFLTTFTTVPSTTRTTDLIIQQNQLIGFQMASNIYRMRVQSTTGNLYIQSYSVAIGTTNFGSNLAFVNGVGPVFGDDAGAFWRLSINTDGSLKTTAL